MTSQFKGASNAAASDVIVIVVIVAAHTYSYVLDSLAKDTKHSRTEKRLRCLIKKKKITKVNLI